MTRILIIEDEILIARFLELHLRQNFDCTINIAFSVEEAQSAMELILPHLVLCDINLQDHVDGIKLVTELKAIYAFEVIYITSYQTKNMIEAATETSPANYLIKPIDEIQLFAGVKLVLDKIKDNPQIGFKLLQAAFSLTATEWRIIDLIRRKKTSKEIAASLHLSPYTIKNQRHKICRKLNLKDENNALLMWALHNTKISG